VSDGTTQSDYPLNEQVFTQPPAPTRYRQITKRSTRWSKRSAGNGSISCPRTYLFGRKRRSPTIVELDQPGPAIVFTLTPPSDAYVAGEFLDALHTSIGAETLRGKSAPNVCFKSADGKLVTLGSFHGGPVYLEFWATWCEHVDLLPVP
jgi:hypothetical protein